MERRAMNWLKAVMIGVLVYLVILLITPFILLPACFCLALYTTNTPKLAEIVFRFFNILAVPIIGTGANYNFSGMFIWMVIFAVVIKIIDFLRVLFKEIKEESPEDKRRVMKVWIGAVLVVILVLIGWFIYRYVKDFF